MDMVESARHLADPEGLTRTSPGQDCLSAEGGA